MVTIIKRGLLLGRQVMTKLKNVLKRRDIILPTKVYKGLYSQSYGFSSSHVWIWELDYKEIWARKNWCFWTMVLKKTFESPLDFKEIQPVQSILKEISPGCSLKGMMLKLKLQYFGHLMRRVDSLEKTRMLGLGAGGEGDDRGWDGWMASLTQWTWVWVNSRRWWWTGRPGGLQFMGSQRVEHDWVTELNWTELKGLEHACLSPSRIHLTKWLWSHLPVAVL